MKEQLGKHYDRLVEQHGLSSQSAQWADKESHWKRLSVLCEISQDLPKSSVLDVGCGVGELLQYLVSEADFKGSYTGLDVSRKAVEAARLRHPDDRFECQDISETHSVGPHDYVVLCGIFNNRMGDEEEARAYLRSLLKASVRLARKGVAFNLISTYVDYRDPDLNYFSPEAVLEFVKNEITDRFTLRNDYLVREGSVPFEISFYLYPPTKLEQYEWPLSQ
ncbi:MAG: class I SAM-dependent methyltransferase [Pseudomonadota bacterium]